VHGALKRNPAARWFRPVALFLLPLALGCGYRFAEAPGQGPMLPLFVTVLQNRTPETGLETRVTNDLVRELTADSRFQLSDQAGGDNVLSGSILSILEDSASRQVSGRSRERRLRVTVSLSLANRGGRVIWRNATLREFETFAVAAEDPGLTTENRSQALDRLSARLARKVRFELGTVLDSFGKSGDSR